MSMKNKIEVLEPNKFVLKYKGNIFRRNSIDYRSMLDKETLREHERQMRRLNDLNYFQ